MLEATNIRLKDTDQSTIENIINDIRSLSRYINKNNNFGYELLDKIIEKTSYDSRPLEMSMLITRLFDLKDVEKLLYVIDNNKNIDGVISGLADAYSYQYSIMFSSNNIDNSYKAILSLSIDHLKVTLRELSDYINGFKIILRHTIYEDVFIKCDVISYIIFKIINNDVLVDATDYQLENLIFLLLKANAPQTLIEFIVKYLSDNSNYKSENYRDQLRTKDKFNYVSLFSEDI